MVLPEPLRPDAWELARLWVNGERSLVITSANDRLSPELIGSLLVESAMTIATAFAQQGRMSEQDALDRIFMEMDEERQRLSASGGEHDNA